MARKSKKKHTVEQPDPVETYLKTRRTVPPPGFSFKDRKKEANKKKCRNKVNTRDWR